MKYSNQLRDSAWMMGKPRCLDLPALLSRFFGGK